tara:strand:+ start:60 stop:191 length:132 start_codon:yes stop_codon:yes gene_type:complete
MQVFTEHNILQERTKREGEEKRKYIVFKEASYVLRRDETETDK